MAYFRLRNDAQDWFGSISERAPFRTKFDVWYMCAVAGLSSGRSAPAAATATAGDIVERFIEDYRPVSRLLIGLLITAELRAERIDVFDEHGVRLTVKRLLDPESPNSLTDEGMRRMNVYASIGYEVLSEARDQKPYAASEFLEWYARLVRSLPEG